jgi:hypothetical protein
MNDERTLRPDFWAVAIDETFAWDLGKYAQYVKSVECTYFFDKNEQTFCCEITPSYLLYKIRSTANFVDDFDVHSREADSVDEFIMTHDWEGDSDMYVHCQDIEKMLGGNRSHHLGDLYPKESLDTYDEMVEDVLEYLQGNEVL